jgi:probable rRNA maturation factor
LKQVATEIANRQRLIPVDRLAIMRLVSAVIAAVQARQIAPASVELTVAFVRDKTIRELNRTYRGNDSATDVLSFQAGHRGSDAGASSETYLGDVVISADAALRQASDGHHDVDREVNELVIHGVLHLCGYDHETDGGEMNRLELKLRRKLLDSTWLSNWP